MNKKSLIVKDGILITVAATFVAFGISEIDKDFWIGGASLLIGSAVFILRGIGKQKGWI